MYNFNAEAAICQTKLEMSLTLYTETSPTASSIISTENGSSTNNTTTFTDIFKMTELL